MYLCFFTTVPAQETKECMRKEGRLFCKSFIPEGYFPGIEVLNVTNMRLEKLDFNLIHDAFPDLTHLTVLGTNTTQLKVIVMPRIELNIKALHLSSLQISNLSVNFTNYFPKLEVLDISGNYLTDFPSFSFDGLKEVYLSENKWNCSNSLEWALNLDRKVFKDLKLLKCFRMPHNNKPVLAIAEFRKVTKDKCTPNCSCRLVKCVTNMDSDLLEPIIEVNCSFRNFTKFPDTLPPKTKILHLEGNVIEDVSPLKQNLIYRDVLDVFLDNNSIKSINVLESSYWLTHFRVLSLQNNHITELPAYALDNALQRNTNMPNAVILTLGSNPWRCDCIFAPRFKNFLQKYANQINNLRDIRCAPGSKNSLKPIVDLSRSSVCHSPSVHSVQDILDLVNAILVLLIIFVLGKLAYDYYYFKKTGRLPWIATKLP